MMPTVLRLLAVMVLALVAAASAQVYSPVALLMRAEPRVVTTYVERPRAGADFVHFSDEPLGFEFDIFNQGETDRRVFSQTADPVADFYVDVLRDGSPANVSITVNSEVGQRGRGFHQVTRWLEQNDLPPESGFAFTATVNELLSPGHWTFELQTAMRDDNGLPLRPQANRVILDVRAPTPDSAAERALRRASAAYGAQHYRGAERWLNALLSVHPNSYVAFAMAGSIAEREGRMGDAIRHVDRAIAILKASADTLYLQANAGIASSHDPLTGLSWRRDALLRKTMSPGVVK